MRRLHQTSIETALCSTSCVAQLPATQEVRYLGIEVGGTKLQFGVGTGREAAFAAFARCDVDRARSAEGIREQIRGVGGRLAAEHRARAVGIGFGGPVDATGGRVLRSFHVEGWDEFPLIAWCEEALGLPTALGNDADLAGLAEARLGAGRGHRVVLYSNVGSGIGGSLIVEGRLYAGGRGVVCEIGHLRPGVEADTPDRIVEHWSSGFGLAAAAQVRLRNPEPDDEPWVADLLARCGSAEQCTGRAVTEAAAAGNGLAAEVLRAGVRTYGWALAQAATLLGPEVMVIGGGVPQAGEELFFAPLRAEVDRYLYPPLRGTIPIVPAALGEEVVVHGAVLLAAAAEAGEGVRWP
jgi:glucokinase